jgi:hypothetical protein
VQQGKKIPPISSNGTEKFTATQNTLLSTLVPDALRIKCVVGKTTNSDVGFEVLTAVSTKMAVFCVVAPCSLVEVYQRFDRPDDEGSKDL